MEKRVGVKSFIAGSATGEIAGFTAAKAEHPTYTDDQLRETVEFKKASQPFGTGGDIQRLLPPQPPQYKDWREGISLRR